MEFGKRLCTALRFLTILPVPWWVEEDSDGFPKSLAAFPVVGILIGCFAIALFFCLSLFLPHAVTAVLVMVYLTFISGGLHLDGLSDSADGLLSARPSDIALKIMKDSSAGPMGVIVVLFVLLTKYAALTSMPQHNMALALFFMPLAGRCAILVMMATLPYAREEGGLGQLFYSGNSKRAAWIAICVSSLAVMILARSYVWYLLVLLFVTNSLFIRWCRVRLGGATGDTLGAICELSEMTVALAFSL